MAVLGKIFRHSVRSPYVLGLLASLVAALAAAAVLALGAENVGLVFLTAIAAVALYGGPGAGLVATLVALGLRIAQAFAAPRALPPVGRDDAVHFALFALVALCAGRAAAAGRRSVAKQVRAAMLARDERVTARLVRLQLVTAALSNAVTRAEVAAAVVEHGIAALEADAGSVLQLASGGTELEILRETGWSQGIVETYRRVPLDAPIPPAEAVRTREPVLIESRAARAAHYPQLAQEHPDVPYGTTASIPLISEGRTVGAMVLGFEKERTFSNDEVAFMLALAHQCSLALERARLYDAEYRARTSAEGAEARARFLAEASQLLATSLDFETSLRNLARLAVPRFSDWCAVHLVQDQSIRTLAVVHHDPALEEAFAAWAREHPIAADAPHGYAAVIRTGRAELIPEVSESEFASMPFSSEELATARSLKLRSNLCVPLVVQDRVLGAITFATTAESNRQYDRADLAFAEELAQRAALALDNALLYRRSQELYHAAQESNRLKDEFLATLSHELRTPLSVVLSWAYLLRTGRLDEPRTALALETIERAARSQAQLIDDLLDVSRIVVGKLRLDVRPVDLAGVVEAAIEVVRPAAEAKLIQLEVDLRRGLGLVHGDATRLQQVVWNLLSNALKFTGKGGRVEVRLERVDAQAEITVRDTGQGINPTFLRHIFDRFRQADNSTTRRQGGLGLGLSIVHHLVELHGGTVEATSEGEGKGACFRVRLPLIAVAVTPREPRLASGEASAGRPDGPPSLTGVRVLVVDDDPDACAFITLALEQQGAAVAAADSVAAALALHETFAPNILVSDIGLPGEDGYSLIRKLRSLEGEAGAGTRLPAIALTAYAGEAARERALLAGYELHLAKPVEPIDLLGAIARLVAERAMRPARRSVPPPPRSS